jgi:predicted permease
MGESRFGLSNDAFRLLAESGLPEDLAKRIAVVLRESRLSSEKQVDVVRELIAHFEDGLSAGNSVQDLLRDFGDERIAARLITRNKRKPVRPERSWGRGDSFVFTFFRNAKYALRRLKQSPGFTATAILSLGLGIGANIAIFSLVNAVLLREAPLEKPEELVHIYETSPRYPYLQFAYPDFEDLRDGTRDAFSGLAVSVTIIGQVDREGSIETILGEAVSGNHFQLLGISAEIGRTFTADDDVRPGAHPVVMISHGYWQRAFGGDPEVIGRDLRLNGRPYTVVGVTPARYHGSLRGVQSDFYAPAMMYDVLQADTRVILEARNSHRFFVMGRLAPGATLAQARASLDRMAEQFRKDFDWGAETGFLLIPQADVIVYPPMDRFVRAAAWLLSGVVGLVLLIACTNLAGFFLARNLDRRKEIAVRLAMGAKRRTLIGQILTETTLMSALGGVAGILISSWLLYALTRADLPLPVPITLDLGVDASVAVFSIVISVAAGLFLGFVPAVQSTRLDIAPTLKDEGAGSGSSRRRLTFRNGLVTAQVAVCLVLLIGAGLFLRSLQQAQAVDPGFGKEPAALLTVALTSNRYPEDGGRALMRQLLERTQQIPGVQSVGLTSNMQLRKTGTESMAVQVDGVEPPPKRRFHSVDYAIVNEGFFDAVGIPILGGRNFSAADRVETQPVAIVSEAMAKKFWPGKDAVGGIIRQDDASDLMVVGVARDTKVLDLSESPRPFIYLPFSQRYAAFTQIVARTGIEPERTALDMVATARELDPELILWAPSTMERHLSFVLLPFRLSALILSVVAVLGMALASVGLFSVVSYAVSQRTREVGIRMSFGAGMGRVIWMLMGSGMRLVAVGSILGLVLSYFLSQGLSSLLYGVGSIDPITFLAAPLVLMTVASFAAFFAARRASRINPIDALRAE